MKIVISVLISIFFLLPLMAQKTSTTGQPDPNKKLQNVEAACGQCKFGLPGKSCDLAVRIKGKSYFVDGTEIDSHGDAHAKDGFCEAIRKAAVQGVVVNNRFQATYFKVLPDEKKKYGKEKSQR